MEQKLKENMRLFINALDENSRKVLWHFRWCGYAKLDELVELIGAASDMEVLNIIREVINPAAVRILGSPVLEFSEARIDLNTGKKIFFNWWLLDFTGDNQSIIAEGEEPLVDFFEEKDKIIIISEVSPSVKVKDSARVEQRNGILSIRLDKLKP